MVKLRIDGVIVQGNKPNAKKRKAESGWQPHPQLDNISVGANALTKKPKADSTLMMLAEVAEQERTRNEQAKTVIDLSNDDNDDRAVKASSLPTTLSSEHHRMVCKMRETTIRAPTFSGLVKLPTRETARCEHSLLPTRETHLSETSWTAHDRSLLSSILILFQQFQTKCVANPRQAQAMENLLKETLQTAKTIGLA